MSAVMFYEQQHIVHWRPVQWPSQISCTCSPLCLMHCLCQSASWTHWSLSTLTSVLLHNKLLQ